MTTKPPPTPISVSSFRSVQDGGLQVSELLGYLDALLREDLAKEVPKAPVDNSDEAWLSILTELGESVFANFPRKDSCIWASISDKVKLCSPSLEVVKRAAPRTGKLLDSNEVVSLTILRHIMALIEALWSWPLRMEPSEAGVDSPLDLRKKASQAFGAITVLYDRSEDKPMLRSLLRVCDELLNCQHEGTWPKQHHISIKKATGEHKLTFKVDNVSELGSALQDMLCILSISVEGLVSANDQLSTWLLRQYCNLLQRLLSFASSSSTLLLASQRCNHLVFLINQAEIYHKYSISLIDGALACIPTAILICRLRLKDEDNDWQLVDEALSSAFQKGRLSICPQSASLLVSELALQCEVESLALLRRASISAIAAALPTLPHRCSESLNVLLAGTQDPEFDALKAQLISSQQSAGLEGLSAVLGKRKRSESSWRHRIELILQPSVFEPGEQWCSYQDKNDNEWLTAVLEAVKLKLTGQLSDTSSSFRTKAATALKSLACYIAHPESEKCEKDAPAKLPLTPSLLPTYLQCLINLADGKGEGLSPEVGRLTQETMTVVLRHHSQGISPGKHDAILDFIQTGLRESNRPTRMAAGRALKALLLLYDRIGQGPMISRHIQSVFKVVEGILMHEKDSVKETCLVAVGVLGKTTDVEVLENVLFIFFTQLDSSSILLKGIAFMQLGALSRYHEKTPYALVSPYFPRISIFIISIMPSQPNALLETCRFLSLSPRDFLSVTLPSTLPQLFGTRNIVALSSLQRELDRPLSSLFLNNSAEILAHVFLLNNTRATDEALKFILRTLSEAANNASITVANVVKSCIMPLLGNLIVSMGDPESNRSEAAKQAIRKVAICLNEPPTAQTDQRLGAFLKNYILGIIAILNDILHDVQGRKTNDMKCKVLSGLSMLIQEVGPSVNAVAPQIMATLQTSLSSGPLAVAALQTWQSFFKTLPLRNLGQYVGPTTAALVNAWPSLNLRGREAVKGILDYVLDVAHNRTEIDSDFMDQVVDLSSVPELKGYAKKLRKRRNAHTVKEQLEHILARMTSDNNIVVSQALEELRAFMLEQHPVFITEIASGDVFHPLVGSIMKTLLTVICRDSENAESQRLVAFECLGVMGAADPDRFTIHLPDRHRVVLSNYTDEEEAIQFALYLVEDTLVSAFRSTSDIKYQSHLAFAIQELLKFCKFTPSLALRGTGNGPPSSLKTRKLWDNLPKHVLETITPLLESRFSAGNIKEPSDVQHPIYHSQVTYREWLQLWVSYLITHTSGATATTIFEPFRLAVRNKDVGVARQLLPHLVLNILISGTGADVDAIKEEIIAVLKDQVDDSSKSSPEKRLLSAQAVFMLMDHLNRWIRVVRQTVSSKRSTKKRTRIEPELQEAELQVTKVDSILDGIDQDLVAKAAFHCQAYARSLMNFEKQILALRASNAQQEKLQPYYDRLHEIYSHLDEPDGMEGIADFIMLPSLEHQIRHHESTGRWTSAQSCWEVRLQQDPDKLEYHLGLLRCLRNLGHFDSLRTHIQGVLVRMPDWEQLLAGFRLEGAWINQDWDAVKLYTRTSEDSWESSIARLLLAMRARDDRAFSEAIAAARIQLGKSITAGGESGYRRSYDAILKLHLVHDIETIRTAMHTLENGASKKRILPELFSSLSRRIDSTLPTFRTREPLLSAHRTVYSLCQAAEPAFKRAVGRSWLESAKLARKAGHRQTAYSAVLQAQESHEPLTFYQSAKLVKETGEPLRALHELDNALRTPFERQQMLAQNVIDLSDDDQLDDPERNRVMAKARLLRARWMRESERFDAIVVAKELQDLSHTLKDLESAHFHAGHFQDENYKRLGSDSDKFGDRGQRMNVFTVKAYVTAIRLGSKYAYQTIPRILTIWLDMGEHVGKAPVPAPKARRSEKAQRSGSADNFTHMNESIRHAIANTPVYKWLSAFPQIVSRVDHPNNQVYELLSTLILTILYEYPQQGLWSLVSVLHSTKQSRRSRGNDIIYKLRQSTSSAEGTSVSQLINCICSLSKELLELCNYKIPGDNTKLLSMGNQFRGLLQLAPSPLIIPLQESMTVTFPASSSTETTHQPFPVDAPTIQAFHDEILVMRTMAKPRRITMAGSDGKVYMFLGKPKDDLRKDARLMDFNSIINKLLNTNSESRRRQLHIRTYSVVTLNEECGFIQWVPNTAPIRPILLSYYSAKGIGAWGKEITVLASKMKDSSEKEAARLFEQEVLKLFPPVFHEWFLDTFPEPSAWLASRLSYGRTIAVMSMVGFILGLGDRHLENILLDVNSGDAIHVDFNCLFERGKLLEIPERVPFRLTQNLIDALGVTGVEGVYRKAAEITMQLLRDNKDVLMSVLDAFIHDPLVEWEDEKLKFERRKGRDPNASANVVKDSHNLRSLAKAALTPIGNKLKGVYSKDANRAHRDKEVTTSNYVQALIEEATDSRNLSKMYAGWTPWY